MNYGGGGGGGGLGGGPVGGGVEEDVRGTRAITEMEAEAVAAALRPSQRAFNKINIYSSTTFGGNISDEPQNGFEYYPGGPIDFMRYRLGRIWQKKLSSKGGSFGPTDYPIKIAQNTPCPNNTGPVYDIESRIPATGPMRFTQREKITIEDTLIAIAAAGNSRELASKWTEQDKWLKALDSTIPTVEQPDPGSHGIISTFSKLQRIEGDNSSAIEFFDYVFDYNSPLTKEVNERDYGSVKPFYAEIKSVYNFYVQTYESILTNVDTEPSPPESILPSLYSFLSFMQNQDIQTKGIQTKPDKTVDIASINTIFEKHITLDGLIDNTRVDTEVTNRSGQQVITQTTKGQYFDKYAYAFADEAKKITPRWNKTTTATPVSLANRFKNQIAPAANFELFSTFNDIVNRFPMYCDITFSTDSSNHKVLEALEETKLTTMLIKDFVDEENAADSSTALFGEKQKMPFNFLTTNALPFIPSNDFKTTPFKFSADSPSELFTSGTLDCWDMITWVESLNLSPSQTYGNIKQGVFLGKFNEEVMMAGMSPLERTIIEGMQSLMALAFVGKFRDIIGKEHRNWKEMVGGSWPRPPSSVPEILSPKKAYHETLFYKVEKWEARSDGTPMGTEPIQNFYFPNSTKIQEHKFTDTQVKYGKRYIYRIYAMEIVFGTKYKYLEDALPGGGVQNLEGCPPGGFNIRTNQARICVVTEPSIKLIKVPYYEKQVVMMDNPPVWPDVDAIPYRGVKDKLLFWLKGNVGDYKLNPVIIQPGDKKTMDSIRLAQDLNSTELVRFKSDDQPQFFEVFRIDKKPNKYSDFIGAKIAHIDTSQNIGDECKSSTTGEWIDTIKPNQKYYYIFRTIDNHGHFSNPSPIYEFEMVHDGYAPFLLRNAYFLEDDIGAPQTATKNFTKYIHIKPAYAQRLLNEQMSRLVNDSGTPNCNRGNCLTNMGSSGQWIQLGTEDQSLWDKKMKIRLISKKTGKRIDVNIKFIHKHIRANEEDNRNNNLC